MTAQKTFRIVFIKPSRYDEEVQKKREEFPEEVVHLAKRSAVVNEVQLAVRAGPRDRPGVVDGVTGREVQSPG